MCGVFFQKKKQTPILTKGQSRLLACLTGSRHIYTASVYKSFFVLLFQKFSCATFYNCLVGNELYFHAARIMIYTSRLHARWGSAAGTGLLGWDRLWGCSPSGLPAHTGAHGASDSGQAVRWLCGHRRAAGTPGKPSLTPAGAPSSPPAALPVPRLPLPFSGPAGPGLPRASAGAAAAARPG